MTTKLVTIGNSMGIRLPKTLIEEYDLKDADIELQSQQDGILISVSKKARENWKEKFAEAVKRETSKSENEYSDFQNRFDETEWTW